MGAIGGSRIVATCLKCRRVSCNRAPGVSCIITPARALDMSRIRRLFTGIASRVEVRRAKRSLGRAVSTKDCGVSYPRAMNKFGIG